MSRALVVCSIVTCIAACAPNAERAPRDVELPQPVIEEVKFPEPVLPGSPVLVIGGKLGTEALDRVTLEIATGDRSVVLVQSAPGDALAAGPSARWFRLDAAAHATLGGEGSEGATCTVHVERAGVRAARAERACSFRLATSVSPTLLEDVDADVFRDDRVAIAASELLLPGEGTLHLEVEGALTVEGADAIPVSATLPVVAAEAPSRDRAEVVVSSALGGIQPGAFEGTMTLVAELGDVETRAAARRLALRFRRPELHAVDATVVSLGQLVTITGGGFVATEDGSAGSQIELEGTFTNERGEAAPCCVQALIPVSSNGREAQVEIAARSSDDGLVLVSELFDAQRGRFSGTMTAVTTTGTERVASEPLPVELVLGARQVVYVHFVAAFDASLERYGLGAANAYVREVALDRMWRIYEGYAIELRTEPPTDFAARGYATLEIGGPDPNGVGLFGYDNTPGKDVGNLRLFDRIGGLNALTQLEADGAPGFGGVFIDSFLYWSAEPGLPGERPLGAPAVEPAFDEIFGPVRARAATPSEVAGTARDERRIAAVASAVRALGAIIGETGAHELGHSLGLAEPYGSPTVFHNLVPDEGCLMDEGSERPFAERAELPGSVASHFCGDEPEYLASILGGV